MREILFRAKRIDNGEWVEGWLLKDEVTGQYFIHASGNSVNESDKVNEEGCLRFVAFEVDENTICQYTGLTDKNGNKIWENDVVSCGGYLVVTWKEEFASFCLSKKGWMYQHFFGEAVNGCDCKVIGNIFDNTDLMTEKPVIRMLQGF